MTEDGDVTREQATCLFDECGIPLEALDG